MAGPHGVEDSQPQAIVKSFNNFYLSKSHLMSINNSFNSFLQTKCLEMELSIMPQCILHTDFFDWNPTSKPPQGTVHWIRPRVENIKETLQSYLDFKQANPRICACIVVPGFYNSAAKDWRPLLKTMTRLHVFPGGTDLLVGSGTASPDNIVKSPWSIEIWIDMPTDPVKLQSAANTLQPPSMIFPGSINGHKCDILADSGATYSFMDLTLAKHLGLKLYPANIVVEVADGHSISCIKKCQIALRIHDYQDTIWVHLLDLGNSQVILGDDWLTLTEAALLYGEGVCRIKKGSRSFSLTPIPSPKAQPAPRALTLTATQLKRHVAEGGFYYMIRVVDDGVTPLPPTPPIQKSDSGPSDDWMKEMPACSQKMQDLLLQYRDVFKPVDRIPPKRGDDMQHVIPLVPGAKPHFRPLKVYSPAELEVINDMVGTLLKQGLIVPSTSSWGAAIVLAKKKDGTLRPCVDWRVLNSYTIPDRHPLPLTEQIFSALNGAQYFSSADLQGGYFQVRLREDEQHLTAFRVPQGLYQFTVLGQGLRNSPASFMRIMSKIFAQQIGRFVLVYMDDILIFSKTQEEHIEHVKEVLQVLRDNEFYAKLRKCEFERPELNFLGHTVGKDGIKPDPKKVSAVQAWPLPKTVTEVRSFLGLANYFRKFIQGFSKLAAPLTHLTKQEGVITTWDEACEKSFQGLKDALCDAPTLAHPDWNKPFEMVADASIIGLGAVLLQDGHPLAYLSKKLSPAEINYTTTDQELLAVVTALSEWRCYLEGGKYNFTIVSDHHPLTHLQTQPTVSRRQARWVEILQSYNWDWQYRPGRINVADPLSRVIIPLNRIHVHLCALVPQRQSERLRNKRPTLSHPPEIPLPLPPKRPKLSKAGQALPLVPPTTVQLPDPLTLPPMDLLSQLVEAYDQDLWFADPKHTDSLKLDESTGVWWRGNCIAVPNSPSLKAGILYELHDAPFSGHPGRDHTLKAVQHTYWWPRMGKDIKDYVASCDKCQRNKGSNLHPAGLLQPLPIPVAPWDSVSMDFITQLPKTKRCHDTILVFVCRLTKMVHFLPTVTTIGAYGLAVLYRDNIFKLHGIPLDVVSDRGVEFCNKFMSELHKMLGTTQKLSTSFHPQTDGQTERVNRVLEDMLRNYTHAKQDDWDDYLAAAEFAVNNSFHDSVRNTPFRLNYGRDPRLPGTAPRCELPAANKFADTMLEGLADAKLCLKRAKDRMKSYADRTRRHISFREGELVLLSSKNLNIRMPKGGTKKLLFKHVGPFPIAPFSDHGSSSIRVSYRLVLPAHMKCHDVFHVSLLKKYDPSRMRTPPPCQLDEEGEEVFNIERILDHRITRKSKSKKVFRQYLIRWEGYGAEYDTWEPEENIEVSEEGMTLARYWEYLGIPHATELQEHN